MHLPCNMGGVAHSSEVTGRLWKHDSTGNRTYLYISMTEPVHQLNQTNQIDVITGSSSSCTAPSAEAADWLGIDLMAVWVESTLVW